LLLATTLLTACAVSATGSVPLTTEQMSRIVGNWTTDTTCGNATFFDAPPSEDGNTCEPHTPPSGVCPGECPHNIWWCCWDPVAQRCHAAFVHTFGECDKSQDDWECSDGPRACDENDPQNTCCWFTNVGPRTGDTCYSPGEYDCIYGGYSACDKSYCETRLMDEGE